MNFFSDLTGSGVSLDALFKFTDLDRRVQKHVQKVYATLAVSLILCAFGVYLHSLTHIGNGLTALMGMGCAFGLGLTPSHRGTLGTRYALMAAFAVLEGLSVGPLVTTVMDVYPSVVMTAFFMTFSVFASFSAAALVARRRSMLYLGSFCAIGLMALMIMNFGSLIFGVRNLWMFQVDLYLGLIIFSIYVLVDTQMIVERASAGDDDHIKASLQLFLDFLNIFIRILIILTDKRQKEEGRERKRR